LPLFTGQVQKRAHLKPLFFLMDYYLLLNKNDPGRVFKTGAEEWDFHWHLNRLLCAAGGSAADGSVS
jgi:hypothetical protein